MTNVDDLFKRVDASLIEPRFLAQAKLLIASMRDSGVDFFALSGYRSPADQEALYAIGRTVETSRKHVTNAEPWMSLHNYGLALDFCRDADMARSGLQPDYKFEDYKVLAKGALMIGLTPGYFFSSFPEGPHVQATTKAPLLSLKQAFQSGGLKAVWALV